MSILYKINDLENKLANFTIKHRQSKVKRFDFRGSRAKTRVCGHMLWATPLSLGHHVAPSISPSTTDGRGPHHFQCCLRNQICRLQHWPLQMRDETEDATRPNIVWENYSDEKLTLFCFDYLCVDYNQRSFVLFSL